MGLIISPEQFRQEASYFEKHGRYDDGDMGTYYWNDWWEEQQRRCLEGYSVGGMYISGYYYFYLNFCHIWKVKKVDYGVFTKKKPKNARGTGERVFESPDWWDEDYKFFTCLDIAERGISLETYRQLPYDLGLIEDDYNFSGGHHLTYLKPRGVGFSFKGGSLAARNYFCLRGSKSYMVAFEKEFLLKDGIVSKFLSYRDFINEKASGFAKHHDYKNDSTEMQWRASVNIDGQERGYKSEVFGITVRDDADKVRGKRGKVAINDESGKNPVLEEVLDKQRHSFEEGEINYGTIVIGGTGGPENDVNLEGLRAIAYDPAVNNMLRFKNLWDEGMSESECCMFTPAYISIAYKDAKGNSLKGRAKEYHDEERAKVEKTADALKLARVKSENPYTLEEALQNSSTNIFVTPQLLAHKRRVEEKKTYSQLSTTGKLDWIGKPRDQKVQFTKDEKLIPLWEYPINKKMDRTGAVVLWEEPIKDVQGTIPRRLYTVNVDPYRFDDAVGDSVGAAYVVQSPNNFTQQRGNKIVAQYIGRPSSGQEDFNHVIFQLAVYYNAKLAFESDEPGDVVGFAKRHGLLHLVEEEFSMAYDEQMATKKSSSRKFGVRVGGGQGGTRKKQQNIYLRNWLYEIRFIEPDGTEYCNFHTIHDIGLLQELCSFKLGSNFDRISAFRVGVLFIQELIYEEILPQRPSSTQNKESLINTIQYPDASSGRKTQTAHPLIAER